MRLSPTERVALWILALVGFLGPNGAFLYFAFTKPARLLEALRQPIAAALMIEALLLVGLIAVALARRPVGRWGWRSFVLFSLIGGLAFSVPMLILLNDPRRASPVAVTGDAGSS